MGKEISDCCKVGSGDYDKRSFVCVYNSSGLLKELEFDKVIVDEAHHIEKPEKLILILIPASKLVHLPYLWNVLLPVLPVPQRK